MFFVGLKAAAFEIETTEQFKIDIVNRRKQYFSEALSLSYNEPIHFEKAAFQYMYDLDGNTYLDAYNNIPLVGYSHPRVSEAVSQQMRQLNTNTRYHYQTEKPSVRNRDCPNRYSPSLFP